MPSSNTFQIKPIRQLVSEYVDNKMLWIDPFANCNKIATITNDLDPQYQTDFNMDALEFLKQFADKSVFGVLLDPPYSPRQVSECYKSLGMTVNMQTTQASFWSALKKEISRIVVDGGYCISCAWNSGGIGKKYGFNSEKIMLVAHGGWHNDTIVVVDKKGIVND